MKESFEDIGISEIWDWERQNEMMKLQLKYLTWTWDWIRTHQRKYWKREKGVNFDEAPKGSVRFEEKNEKRNDKIVLDECLREMEMRDRQSKPRSI